MKTAEILYFWKKSIIWSVCVALMPTGLAMGAPGPDPSFDPQATLHALTRRIDELERDNRKLHEALDEKGREAGSAVGGPGVPGPSGVPAAPAVVATSISVMPQGSGHVSVTGVTSSTSVLGSSALALSAPTVEVFGRINVDHWSIIDSRGGIGALEHPSTNFDPEDRTEFRRVRMGMEGKRASSQIYKFEVDFANPNSATIKDAYIGFEDVPVLQTVLIGNQKRPLGLDHLNSSKYNVFLERPLVVEAFNEDARRFGVAAYGRNAGGDLNWRAGVYNLENISGDGHFLGDSLQLSLNGRVSGTPWWEDGGQRYLHLGLAGMWAHPDGDVDSAQTNANENRFRTRPEFRTESRWIDTGRIAGTEEYTVAAAEAVLNLDSVSLVGEYQRSHVERTGRLGPAFAGGYVYVSWFLTGEHQPFDRRSGTLARVKPRHPFEFTGKGWGAVQLAARASVLNLSDRDIRGGYERNLSLALDWWFNSHSRLQVNYVSGDIEEHASVNGFTDGDFSGVGTRFMLDF